LRRAACKILGSLHGPGEDLGFRRTGDLQHDHPRGDHQERQERDSRDLRLHMPGSGDVPDELLVAAIRAARLAGEQRTDVPVWPEAEEDEIEPRR